MQQSAGDAGEPAGVWRGVRSWLCVVEVWSWLCDVGVWSWLCDVEVRSWLCDVEVWSWLCDVHCVMLGYGHGCVMCE